MGCREADAAHAPQPFAALDDEAGVQAHRRGALERVGFVLDDFYPRPPRRRRRRRAHDRGARRPWRQGTGQLGPGPGLDWGGGNPGPDRRPAPLHVRAGDWSSTQAWRATRMQFGHVRGTNEGDRARRPGLRIAAPGAGSGERFSTTPSTAARNQHLTQREHNRLKPTQAQAAIAAALLRHYNAVIVTGRPGMPTSATHGTRGRGSEGRSMSS